MKSIDDLLTLKEVKAEFERQSDDRVRSGFFYFLMKGMKTRQRAEQWLRDKNITPEDAAVMLDDAEKANLINDKIYAREFIECHDNWGKKRIIFELGRRGISDSDIRDAFGEIEFENKEIKENEEFEEIKKFKADSMGDKLFNKNKSEHEKINQLIKSWLDSGYDLNDKKDLNKIKGRLYRRGFYERDIRSALEEFI